MSKLSDCIAKTSRTKDGIRIEGHVYGYGVAVIDDDTGRTYFIDRCQNCDKWSAGFITADSGVSSIIEQYDSIINVGGLNE